MTNGLVYIATATETSSGLTMPKSAWAATTAVLNGLVIKVQVIQLLYLYPAYSTHIRSNTEPEV